jgi:hypothetical protein
MRVRNVTLRLVMLLVLSTLPLPVANAAADPILLDQQALAFDRQSGFAIIPAQSVSQTFTAGLSGLLSFVDVSLYRHADAVGDVVLSLLAAPLVTNTAVFSATIPRASIPVDDGGFLRVSVAGAGVFVNPGDVWAIHLSRSAGGGAPPWVIWNFAVPYAGGTAYTSLAGEDILDVAFRTSVDVGTAAPIPEPTSLLLFGTGSVGLAWKAWRRRRALGTS